MNEKWHEVAIDLDQYDNSLKGFQESCSWLHLNCKEKEWTHSIRRPSQIIFFIKDPKIAMLFKLTWT